ncbi:tRNA 2-selenouridine(34) synthase MnmH [Rhodonellum sp.]|uniref:tRNA 2-selenouridine(34) synthase MnmH n=1 Tax=Rhodonellum sp. TaxID=2231180 RepID=UPI0027217408|nr:tRNA 2-selenouridine(34) synthase MnmH [Rhodonellum sp.]MDO9552018.1 tRNA 2-selenouridine(34) synthase MnmH [Rhodonellum sp.]
MSEKLITLSEFLKLRETLPILDARSESEFIQSHIPGALNLPILNDGEREIVGTLYKQEGNESAVLKGFELVGPRFHQIQKEVLLNYPDKKILLYCWRGGMRSQILSWLLGMVGFEVFRLKGGYKTYRTFTYERVRKPYNFIVLGGKTGTGKTVLLKALEDKGEQVVDLEGLAHHRGSSFGGIGQEKQPSVEQFENLLAERLIQLDQIHPIWIENESRNIGKVTLPDGIFQQILTAPIIKISKTEAERITHIEEEYASLPKEELKNAILRLSNKLGGLRTTEALEDLEMGRHRSWIENMLVYYDKTYGFDLNKPIRQHEFSLDLSQIPLSEACQNLLKIKNDINAKSGNQTDTVE